MKKLIILFMTLAVMSTLGCNGSNGNKGSLKLLDIRDLMSTYDEKKNPYSDPKMWLSGPPATEDYVLSVNLDTTVVHPDMSTEVIHPVRPAYTDFDIFYIHPTVNLGFEPGNDDLSDLTNTKAFVTESIARFSTVGRVIVPLYHSATAGCFLSVQEGVLDECLAVAYQDVEDAFIYYLANYWGGEKLAIMGYSQGAIHARRLVQKLVEKNPALMSRIVMIMPIGGDLEKNSFVNIPACEATEQTGCYISYHSFIKGLPPQAGTVLGDWSDSQAACNNVVGAPGEEGVYSMSYFSLPTVPGALPADALNEIPITIDTPFMAFPEFYAGMCKNFGTSNWLQVGHADSYDQRWTPINYFHTFTNTDAPFGLGLHLFDWSIPMGDLLQQVKTKSAQFDGSENYWVVK